MALCLKWENSNRKRQEDLVSLIFLGVSLGSKVSTMTMEFHTHISFNSPGKKTPGWRGGCQCWAANQEELCFTKHTTLDKWEGLKSVMTSLTLLLLKSLQGCHVLMAADNCTLSEVNEEVKKWWSLIKSKGFARQRCKMWDSCVSLSSQTPRSQPDVSQQVSTTKTPSEESTWNWS